LFGQQHNQFVHRPGFETIERRRQSTERRERHQTDGERGDNNQDVAINYRACAVLKKYLPKLVSPSQSSNNLTELTLYNCRDILSDPDAMVPFFEALKKNTQLQELSLLPPCIGRKTLSFMRIRNKENRICHPSIVWALSEMLKNNSTLRVLIVGGNNPNVDLSPIARALEHWNRTLQTLTIFDLRNYHKRPLVPAEESVVQSFARALQQNLVLEQLGVPQDWTDSSIKRSMLSPYRFGRGRTTSSTHRTVSRQDGWGQDVSFILYANTVVRPLLQQHQKANDICQRKCHRNPWVTLIFQHRKDLRMIHYILSKNPALCDAYGHHLNNLASPPRKKAKTVTPWWKL